MFELIALVLLAVISRLLVVRSSVTRFDAYGHMYFAKEIKRQRTGVFGEIILNIVGSTGFIQPFLWHWLVARFPIDRVVRFQRWINPMLDALFALAIYFIVLWCGLGKVYALYASALYICTPMFFSVVSKGPRISSFTPRLSSELATNLFFVVSLLPLGLPEWAAITIAAVLAAFVILASKFGLQALLFITPLVSLLLLTPDPLLSMMLGFVGVLAVSRGKFWASVSAQVKHLVWYCKKNLKGEMPISRRNSFKALFQMDPSKGKITNLLNIAYQMATVNSYTSVLVKMPVLLAVLGLYIVAWQTEGVQIEYTYLMPVLAGVIVFFVINYPPFLFLGEAERYLNHVAFFIVLAVVQLSVELSTHWVLWSVLGYGVLYWFAEVLFLGRYASKAMGANNKAFGEIIDHLVSVNTPLVVLVYPYVSGGGVYRVMLETDHKVIFVFGISEEFSKTFDREYADTYPYVKLNQLDRMSEDLGVNCVVVFKKALENKGLGQWEPLPEWQKMDLGGSVYDVYQKQ